MKKLLTLVLGVAVLGIASVARAGGHNDAGCGVGTLIFKDNTKVQQILAVTTNQWMQQSFSITSGTSGCTPDGASAKRHREREIFVAVNYRSLSKELATGDGEYASSFGSLMGCSQEALPVFLDYTKSNYGKLFKEGTTPKELLGNMEMQISSDRVLSQVCTL
jgi:hypothetical protein